MKKVGRPQKLEGVDLEYVERLAESGMTMQQIAVALGVVRSTVNKKSAESQEFSDAVNRGRAVSDEKVERSLYARAIGYAHPDVHVSQGRQGVVLTKITKHYPPDVAACFIWLKNRKPDLWRDRPEPDETDRRPINFNFISPPEKGE